MDVRRRVLAARLAVRIEKDKEYSKAIGLFDRSGYRSISQGGEQDVYDDPYLIDSSRTDSQPDQICLSGSIRSRKAGAFADPYSDHYPAGCRSL